MRQTIYRVDHAPTLGVPSYTTAWRIGNTLYHTYTYAGVTGRLGWFPLHHHERDYATAAIVESTFTGTVTRIS